jgi:hypothetical protein
MINPLFFFSCQQVGLFFYGHFLHGQIFDFSQKSTIAGHFVLICRKPNVFQ